MSINIPKLHYLKSVLLISIFLISINSYSQSYTFSKSSSTFNSISTNSPNQTFNRSVFLSPDGDFYGPGDDEGYVSYDFDSTRFQFMYNGTNYSSFYITSSGFINFTNNFSRSFYSSPPNNVPFLQNDINYDIIAPLWTDLTIDTVYVKIIGTAGDRIMIIEFENRNNYGSQVDLSFQIKLYEGSNNIEFVYGNSIFDPTNGSNYIGNNVDNLVNDSKLSVGLNFKGVTNPTYLGINRLDLNAGLLNTYSSADQTIKYTSGLSFLFSPPSISISTPTGTLTSNCAGIPSVDYATFDVIGSNLSSPVIITAPSNFEISLSSSGAYSSSLTLPQASTVSQTVYIRLSSSATTNGASGTISATSSGATTVTTTVSSTTVDPPSFVVTGPYLICAEGTYPVNLTGTNYSNGWSVSSPDISVNSTGYVTAGTVSGDGYTVSYTDACGQTVSENVTVNNLDNADPIIGGLASYKINNTTPLPQGPSANVYVGYNGFNYYSTTTPPTKPGFYKANNLSSNNAGCPFPFEIFRCTKCPD